MATKPNMATIADEAAASEAGLESLVPPLKDADHRAAGLVDVGVEADEVNTEKVLFAMAAAKRREGGSFLGDFAAALLEHAADAQAQLFQDVFAAFIAGRRRNGFFIEVGTGDGKLISNTYMLEKTFGWDGLVVEPNPIFLPALRQNRTCRISTDCVYDVTGRTIKFMCTADPEFSRIQGGNADLHDDKRSEEFAEVELTTISLNDLLRLHECPARIDYLSLDVEGAEFDILQTFDFAECRIDCITVEHNWSGSRGRLYDLLTANGFVRVFEHFSQWDDWYVQRDLLAEMPTARHLLPASEDCEPELADADHFVQWAMEALARGEPQVAEALCVRAIEINAGLQSAYRTLAEAAGLQGRRKLALERWRTAVSRDPTDYWARIGLAETLAVRGDLVDAVEHLTQAVTLSEDPRARDMLDTLVPKVGHLSG
jgi:FkbM family methyltransferase